MRNLLTSAMIIGACLGSACGQGRGGSMAQQSARISGVVLDIRGERPLSGARVTLSKVNPGLVFEKPPTKLATEVTDRDGRFSFDVVADGSLEIWATHRASVSTGVMRVRPVSQHIRIQTFSLPVPAVPIPPTITRRPRE